MSGGYALVAVHGLLISVASLVVKHGLQGVWASVVVARELNSCGSRTLEHRLSSCGTGLGAPWHVDLPRSGIELMSSVLAGRFFTTEPPREPELYTSK